MSHKFAIDEHESNIDNLLVTRRLAQFCPTSLSIDDLKSHSKGPIMNKSKNTIYTDKSSSAKVEYIPPTPSVKIETTAQSAFKLGIPSAKHRFGFLLADIKPIEQTPNNSLKMKYELPNVRKVSTPVKSIKPLLVVSFSTTCLNRPEKIESPLSPSLNPLTNNNNDNDNPFHINMNTSTPNLSSF